MTQAERILLYMAENGGTVTTGQVNAQGIPRVHLKQLVEDGRVMRLRRGLYALPEHEPDEMAMLQSSYSKGIFSHGTALFLHDLTDRTPLRYTMTFPVGYHAQALGKQDVKCVFIKPDLWPLGVEAVKTPYGEYVWTYNMERTICDILRAKNAMDIQVVTEAMKRYVQRNDKDLRRLTQYARQLRIEDKVRQYLEVLL